MASKRTTTNVIVTGNINLMMFVPATTPPYNVIQRHHGL